MIRINQTVLLGCAVVTFSLLSIAFADETLPAPANDQKEILCVMPTDAKDPSGNSVKKMTLEECKSVGGKPATPHAMPTAPKPKD